jgi:S1-C subfamily serine protease
MRLVSAAVTALALGLLGCAAQADDPPPAAPAFPVSAVEAKSPDVQAAEDAKLPELAQDSLARGAKELTVRVRNIGCAGIATGSGFALTRRLLITNRHVLAGASGLEVSTWDGRSFTVTAAEVGRLKDIGVAIVDGQLPIAAQIGRKPRAHDVVTAVGYPGGGPLHLSHGVVVDRVDGQQLGIAGTVVRITSRIRPGNSGGPLLDDQGRVVGIVYAIEIKTGLGLAIPVDTIRRLVRIGGFEAVPACGAD